MAAVDAAEASAATWRADGPRVWTRTSGCSGYPTLAEEGPGPPIEGASFFADPLLGVTLQASRSKSNQYQIDVGTKKISH